MALRILKALLFVLALSCPALADTSLYRESTGNVVLRSGETALRFYPRYGGAALQAYRAGYPPLLHESPGAALQTAVRTGGNDPTEGGSNGIMEYPIARLDDVATWGNAYYGREVAFDAARRIYRRVLFMPDFWASMHWVDDAIPEGGRWLTPYWPGIEASTLDLPARPVIFQGDPREFTGLFFVGDERIDNLPWAERLREYPNGRVAMKVTVSFAAAPWSAFAGIVFRKSVPRTAVSVEDAYRAPGLGLLVNKVGGWALVRWGTDGERTLDSGPLDSVQRGQLEGPGGLQLEVRTHNGIPGYVEVWLGGRFVRAVMDDRKLAGPHLGLLANSDSGRVFFQNRMPVDVGIEADIAYSAWGEGFVTDVTIRTAPYVTEPRSFDRANPPAAFLNTTTFPVRDRTIARVHHVNGRYVAQVIEDGIYPIPDQFGWWAGNAAGTAGLLAIPEVMNVDGRWSPGAHINLQRWADGEFVLMPNPLTQGAETEAREIRTRIRWATSLSGGS